VLLASLITAQIIYPVCTSSKREFAMTLKNKISELAKRFSLRKAKERSGSIRKSTKNFQIMFLGDELEKRQLLASYSYASGLITIQTNSINEQLSILSTSNNGNYTITTTGSWTGSAVAGLASSGTSLYVNQPSGLTSILVNDNGGTVGNSSFQFGTSTASFVNSLSVNFTSATSGPITVANSARFTNGASLSLATKSNCITVSQPLSATGSGGISLSGRNIVVTNNINTASGDIALYGNGGGSYQTGSFDGVSISGSSVNVNTAGGNIAIDGRGALNTGAAGVSLASSKVQAGGSGSLTITGVSGNGASDWAVGTLINAATVTTSSGSLTVNGTSCGTQQYALGVFTIGANIAATSAGNVTITGTSANGINNACAIVLYSSTYVTTNTGSISINGTSCGTGTRAFAFLLNGSSIISATGGGNVTITGNAVNGTNDAAGVFLYAYSKVTTTKGSIVVNGTSCATGTGSTGVSMDSSIEVSATGGGNVTITGSTPRNLGTDSGININSSSKVYSNGGSITLNTNKLDLSGTVNATTAGRLLIQTLGAGVNLGDGTDTSANLGLSLAELGQITANLLTIGNSSTGNIAVTAAISRPANGSLTLITGNTASSITVGAALSTTGSGGISLTGNSVVVTSNITTAAGLITLTANSVNLTGTVNATTGGNVLIQTLGAGVNLGGADDSSNLGLTTAEIGKITANMLTIGSNTTGNISVTTAITFPVNTSLALISSPISG
jgi:hypothetical protein